MAVAKEMSTSKALCAAMVKNDTSTPPTTGAGISSLPSTPMRRHSMLPSCRATSPTSSVCRSGTCQVVSGAADMRGPAAHTAGPPSESMRRGAVGGTSAKGPRLASFQFVAGGVRPVVATSDGVYQLRAAARRP